MARWEMPILPRPITASRRVLMANKRAGPPSASTRPRGSRVRSLTKRRPCEAQHDQEGPEFTRAARALRGAQSHAGQAHEVVQSKNRSVHSRPYGAHVLRRVFEAREGGLGGQPRIGCPAVMEDAHDRQ